MAVDLNAMLAKIADEFGSTLDTETCGHAFMIAASAVVRLCTAHMPATVVTNVIALAGEQLVREARHG